MGREDRLHRVAIARLFIHHAGVYGWHEDEVDDLVLGLMRLTGWVRERRLRGAEVWKRGA